MVFAKTRIWNYQDIARIKVGDHIIRPSKQAKFLGVTLTPTFSWTEHINGLITKAMKGVSLIKMLTQETWVTTENLTHLTAALVRARLTYGHEAYFNAPKSQWQRLASTKLMALKHALVKDNGEVGCALVIPDLGITKKYHLNNGIGIYTTELYAILKACETINDMPQPPRAAVILTDSKSSLQGLASGRTKNRQEFQAEIFFLTHQILYKGTDLTLMWLPSHTGIKGNELADKAAKRATEDGTHVTLQLSTLEMKNKIRQTANNIRNDTLKTRCTEHGWVFTPMPKTSPRLTLPRKNQKLLRRIRTGHHRSTFQNITCQCGKEATLQHIFSDCPSLNSSTTKLKDYKQKHSLGTQDFLLPHPTLGTQPIRLLTDTIMNSETDQWF
ncbi:hypothetical protein ACOMHN_009407 [Nucella lapillus]